MTLRLRFNIGLPIYPSLCDVRLSDLNKDYLLTYLFTSEDSILLAVAAYKSATISGTLSTIRA